MDIRKIKKLIELVNATGISELELSDGEDSVRISRHSNPPHMAAPVQMEAQPAPAPTAPQAPTVSMPSKTNENDGTQVLAPMVGTVYLAATPGAKPFVEVGDRVQAGDNLCLIEAMKMFNQIEAEVSGVISARLIDNQQPVEFNQPLFIITED